MDHGLPISNQSQASTSIIEICKGANHLRKVYLRSLLEELEEKLLEARNRGPVGIRALAGDCCGIAAAYGTSSKAALSEMAEKLSKDDDLALRSFVGGKIGLGSILRRAFDCPLLRQSACSRLAPSGTALCIVSPDSEDCGAESSDFQRLLQSCSKSPDGSCHLIVRAKRTSPAQIHQSLLPEEYSFILEGDKFLQEWVQIEQLVFAFSGEAAQQVLKDRFEDEQVQETQSSLEVRWHLQGHRKSEPWATTAHRFNLVMDSRQDDLKVFRS